MFVDMLSKKILKKLNTNNKLSKIECEQIHYSLQVLIGESLKFIFLIIFFLCLDKISLFLYSLIILMSIRSNCGGIHINNSIGCLLFSTLFFIITVLLAPNLPSFSKYFYYTLGIIDILIISIKSPCPSINRPIKTKKRAKTLKALSVLATTIWILILTLLIKNPRMVNCGFTTVTIQAFQLIFIKERNVLYEKIY